MAIVAEIELRLVVLVEKQHLEIAVPQIVRLEIDQPVEEVIAPQRFGPEREHWIEHAAFGRLLAILVAVARRVRHQIPVACVPRRVSG